MHCTVTMNVRFEPIEIKLSYAHTTHTHTHAIELMNFVTFTNLDNIMDPVVNIIDALKTEVN